MNTKEREQASVRRSLSELRPFWLGAVGVALALGVLLGWRYAPWLEPGPEGRFTIDRSLELLSVVGTTAQSAFLATRGRKELMAYPCVLMLFAVLTPQVREPSMWLVKALAALLWLAVLIACTTSRNRMALWAIVLCGGFSSSLSVYGWIMARS